MKSVTRKGKEYPEDTPQEEAAVHSSAPEDELAAVPPKGKAGPSASADSSSGKNVAVKSRARRRMPRWALVILAVFTVLLAIGGGYLVFMPHVQLLSLPKLPKNLTMSDLGIENWQSYRQALPQQPLDNPQLPKTPVVDPKLAALQDAAGLALIEQNQLERGLAYLRAAVQSGPDNLRYGNDYRLALRDHRRFNDEEQLFDALYKEHNTLNVGIGLALSYVDQMRSCPKPPDGLVCQAQYSSRSISLLNALLEKHPYAVIARYARGLNHLYWPTLMGHLPTSQKDLEYAVALTAFMRTSSPAFIDDAYAALGDVFGKDRQVDSAINVWRNGLQVVPTSSLLQSRLDIPRDKVVDEMEGPIRGLGVYVDTDVVLFWT